MPKRSGFIDLLLVGESQAESIGIELKLHKDSLSHAMSEESFEYSGNAPLDGSRTEFWRDVSRLETWINDKAMRAGFALMLTNASGLWDPTRVRDRFTNDHAFRMHEGVTSTGTLDYIGTSVGKYGRPVTLAGRYTCHWRDYARVGPESTRQFKYLIIEVPSNTP